MENINMHVKGALYGVCVGDAFGAPLEFLGRYPNSDDVSKAYEMKGGGVINTKPGQITDDGELMLCLYRSLVEKKQPALFYYKKWLKSGPIDVGITCNRAFKNGEMDFKSKANGALMRCAPIGAVYHDKSPDCIADIAMADCRLSHPNLSCQYANAVYCICIACLIEEPDKVPQGAFNWLEDQPESDAKMEVKSWLLEAWSPEKWYSNNPMNQIGFVRWGFVEAFRHIHLKSDFKTAMVATAHLGGDTDTNCAIVGGLVGARCGVEGIPYHMLEAVISSKNERPTWLHPSYLD